MQIGINRWTFPNHLTLAKCFQIAAQSGFETIEINMAEDGELRPDSTEAEVKAIVASAQAAGIGLSSLSTGLGWKYPLTSPDAAIRDKGKEVIRTSLQIAEWMGVDTVLVVPGIVTPDTAYDEAYARAQEALRELAPVAEKHRISIGVENVWNKFLLSPLEFARFLDEINSPFVGAYFDAGNVLLYGYPDQWIRILGDRIRRVHVKDFKANVGNGTGFANLLQGDVPWAKVRAALEAIGYDGAITAEVDGYKTHFEVGIRHIADCIRAAFKE
jgi:L-ribulose-5-phosphate 3-epimerase